MFFLYKEPHFTHISVSGPRERGAAVDGHISAQRHLPWIGLPGGRWPVRPRADPRQPRGGHYRLPAQPAQERQQRREWQQDA